MTTTMTVYRFIGAGLLLLANAELGAETPVRMLESAPISVVRVGQAGSFTWAEYCPDNTCEVIRTKRRTDKGGFATVALAYFFYFSEYVYLDDWRTQEKKVTVEEMLSGVTEKCKDLADKALGRCVLLESTRASAIELMFVRYDEGKTLTGRIDFLQKIQAGQR